MINSSKQVLKSTGLALSRINSVSISARTVSGITVFTALRMQLIRSGRTDPVQFQKLYKRKLPQKRANLSFKCPSSKPLLNRNGAVLHSQVMVITVTSLLFIRDGAATTTAIQNPVPLPILALVLLPAIISLVYAYAPFLTAVHPLSPPPPRFVLWEVFLF